MKLQNILKFSKLCTYLVIRSHLSFFLLNIFVTYDKIKRTFCCSFLFILCIQSLIHIIQHYFADLMANKTTLINFSSFHRFYSKTSFSFIYNILSNHMLKKKKTLDLPKLMQAFINLHNEILFIFGIYLSCLIFNLF